MIPRNTVYASLAAERKFVHSYYSVCLTHSNVNRGNL